MRPDIVIWVRRSGRDRRFARHRLIDDQHLRDIGDLEEVSVVIRLLGFDDVG